MFRKVCFDIIELDYLDDNDPDVFEFKEKVKQYIVYFDQLYSQLKF